MQKIITAVLCLFLTVCGSAKPAVIVTKDNNFVHWGTHIQVVMEVSTKEAWQKHLTFAVGYWNYTIGRDVLLEEDRCTSAACVYIVRTDKDTEYAGMTRLAFEDSGNIVTAIILLSDGMDENIMQRVLVHELGHVLGLAHDDNKESLMYPYAEATPWVLLPEVRKYLQQRYQ